MWVHPLSKTGHIMDGHFALIPPVADSGDPFFNDKHWAVTHKGKGLGMPPNSVKDPSIAALVKRIAEMTKRLIQLPPDSDESIAKTKELQDTYKTAFEKFAANAGKDLALRVKRSAIADPKGTETDINW